VERSCAELRQAVLPQAGVRVLRHGFGLRQDTIARACGTSARTVRAWEAGVPPRPVHADRLTDLVDVVLILAASLVPRGFDQWLNARLRLLEGRRAVDVLAQGDAAAVLRAAQAFVAGDYV